MLKSIERQGNNCKWMVENLLTFARIPKRAATKTDVVQDLQRVVNMIIHSLLVNTVDLRTDIEEDLPEVRGDGQQLELVFLNIINNAVEAMEGGGMLTLSARRSDGMVRIGFTDTGCGISPEQMDRIFEPFFTTRRAGRGTGLGLPVSYGIVKKFGGDIQVKSQTRAEGKDPGTTFIVTLPVVDV